MSRRYDLNERFGVEPEEEQAEEEYPVTDGESLEDEKATMYQRPKVIDDYVASREPSEEAPRSRKAQGSISSVSLIKKQISSGVNELAKETNRYMKESKKKDGIIKRLQGTIEKLKAKASKKASKPAGKTRRKKEYVEENVEEDYE
jgi:hypothetical protein